MAHEEEQLVARASEIEIDDPLMANEIRLYHRQRQAANTLNHAILDKLFSHPDFDGNSSLGDPLADYPVPAAPPPIRVLEAAVAVTPTHSVLARPSLSILLDDAGEDDTENDDLAIEDFLLAEE
jgi:hypothetical protein